MINTAQIAHELGRIVMQARKKKLINQMELADLSGVTQATIQRLESGNAPGLKLDFILSLAKALGLSISQLLFALERKIHDEPYENQTNDNWQQHISRLNPSKKEKISDIILELLEKD